MSGKYECCCRTATGKEVRLVVTALNHSQAHFKIRKEMAMRFRGKTYKITQPVKYIK